MEQTKQKQKPMVKIKTTNFAWHILYHFRQKKLQFQAQKVIFMNYTGSHKQLVAKRKFCVLYETKPNRFELNGCGAMWNGKGVI